MWVGHTLSTISIFEGAPSKLCLGGAFLLIPPNKVERTSASYSVENSQNRMNILQHCQACPVVTDTLGISEISFPYALGIEAFSVNRASTLHHFQLLPKTSESAAE